MKKLILIANFIIMLIIMLPVCFAADLVEVMNITGKDGVWDDTLKKGYRAKKDIYHINIEAERSDGEEVMSDMIRLQMDSHDIEIEPSCALKEESTKKYMCSYQSEEYSITDNKLDILAKLCYGASCINSQPVSMIIDDIGPSVSITKDPEQEGLDVKLMYSSTDTAYPGSGAECAGIDYISFYDGDNLVHSEDIDSSTCFIGSREGESSEIKFFIGGSGKKNLTIKAVDRVGNEGDPAHAELVLDHEEPTPVDNTFKIILNGNKINKIPSSGSSVSAEILIESEDAVNPIAYADFSALSTDPANSNITGSCAHKSTRYYTCRWTNINLDKSGDASDVKLYVKDSFGNIAPHSPGLYPITIENTAPALVGSEFTIIKDGEILMGVPESGTYVEIYANITDEYPGVSTRDMFIDASDIGGGENIPVSGCERHLLCTQIEDGVCIGLQKEYYACRWANVFVKIQETKEGVVNIDAADLFGNRAAITQKWKLELDTTDPLIRHLGVGEEHVRDDVNWLKPAKDTKITVVIEETGSGIIPENVVFNVGEATNCTKSAGLWRCWIKKDTTTPIKELSVTVKDNVGNSASAKSDLNIDNDLPVKEYLEIYSENPAYFRAGDEGITIIAELSDISGFKNDQGDITVSADLSELFNEAYSDVKAKDCVINETTWTCRWFVDEAITAGELLRIVKFNFTDVAGNKLLETETITVRDNEDAEPNFFELVIKQEYIIPIEEFTVKKIAGDYLQTIPFDLQNSKSCVDAEAYDWRMSGSCSESLVYMQQIKDKRDYTGFIQLAIDPRQDFDSTKEDFTLLNCRLEFTSRCGNNIYSQPEKESINISIPIVNEFEEPGERIEKKVENIKKGVEGDFYNLITKTEKFLDKAENICAIKNMFSSLISSLKGISYALGGIANAYPPFEGAYNVVKRIDKVVDSKVYKGVKKFLDTTCGMVMCDAPQLDPGEKGGSLVTGGWCSYLKEHILSSNKAGKAGAIFEEGIRQTSTLELCKQSWMFSAACFCVPGIVYNINKKRQLDCWKGVCYRDYTAAGLMSMRECDEQHAYDHCVFMSGQFTALLFPFEDMASFVLDIIENPLSYAAQAAWEFPKKVLSERCNKADNPKTEIIEGTAACIPYTVMLVTETVMSFIQSAKTISTMEWDGAEMDYCKVLLDPEVKQDR